MINQVSISALAPVSLAVWFWGCSVGQKIPAFIPKPKTESTELFFSWWFRTELGGYMMVLSCSSGLPSCDLACIFMPVKGCFKHRKRASMVIKHTHTHTHTESMATSMVSTPCAHSNHVCKRKWIWKFFTWKKWGWILFRDKRVYEVLLKSWFPARLRIISLWLSPY